MTRPNQPKYNKAKREKYAADAAYRAALVAKTREYVAANPEKVSESNRRYRWKPEIRKKKAASSRDWHEKNRDVANRRRVVRKQNQRLATPWVFVINGAKARAKKKSLPFDLTPEWAHARWTGRCELTDIAFTIGLRGVGAKMFSPSIDKIDPALGYVQSNCRIILWCVNAFKYDGTDEQMFMVAAALTRLKGQGIVAEHQEQAA